jgi:hypothetical protein
MFFFPISGLTSPILDELGSEADCERPYSSSANDRSIGAETWVGLHGVVSVFHFVLGTGGRWTFVAVEAFLGLGRELSVGDGRCALVLVQSGSSSGCFRLKLAGLRFVERSDNNIPAMNLRHKIGKRCL